MLFLTVILYSKINPITMEAIKSKDAIRSCTAGPEIKRYKATVIDPNSIKKDINRLIFSKFKNLSIFKTYGS